VQQGDYYFEYDNQATIEWLIIENNSACFCLTENTPPMTGPLLLELGYLSNMEAAKQNLGGAYAPPPILLKIFQSTYSAPLWLTRQIVLTLLLLKWTSMLIGRRLRNTHHCHSLPFTLGTTTKQLWTMTNSAKCIPSL
jgi:hypothetical protein